jgi:hypothetical protein
LDAPRVDADGITAFSPLSSTQSAELLALARSVGYLLA